MGMHQAASLCPSVTACIALPVPTKRGVGKMKAGNQKGRERPPETAGVTPSGLASRPQQVRPPLCHGKAGRADTHM